MTDDSLEDRQGAAELNPKVVSGAISGRLKRFLFDELCRHLRAAESSRRDWAAEAMRLETENERLREALPTYLKLLDLAEASIAGVVMDTDEDKGAARSGVVDAA